MNEIEVNDLIDSLTREYSAQLINSLTEIIQSPPKSMKEYQDTLNTRNKVVNDANIFVKFVGTLPNVIEP